MGPLDMILEKEAPVDVVHDGMLVGWRTYWFDTSAKVESNCCNLVLVGPNAPVGPVGPVRPIDPVGPATVDGAPVGPVTVDGAPAGPTAPVGPFGKPDVDPVTVKLLIIALPGQLK